MAGKVSCESSVAIVADLGSLVNKAEGSDVEFVFGEGLPWHGHRAILAARCAYFQRLFFGTGASMAEGHSRAVQIRDCPREAFLTLLKLLYTGESDVTDPVALVETHRLLDPYEIPSMKEGLHAAVVRSVTMETIVGAIEAAHRANCGRLCMELIDKLLSTDMARILHSGDVAEMVTKDVLLARRACQRPMGHDTFELKLGVVKRESSTKFVANGNKRQRQEEEVALHGGEEGWNAVVLKVPGAEREFSVSAKLCKGLQVILWVLTDDDLKEDAASLESEDDWVERLVTLSCNFKPKITRNSELQLTFRVTPSPCATLFQNGQEIFKQAYPQVSSAFSPVLILGDFDGVKNLMVSSPKVI